MDFVNDKSDKLVPNPDKRKLSFLNRQLKIGFSSSYLWYWFELMVVMALRFAVLLLSVRADRFSLTGPYFVFSIPLSPPRFGLKVEQVFSPNPRLFQFSHSGL